MATQHRFMIIDGNALVHRAFHALPPLSTKDGVLVNAVYGFTTVFMKALKELQPEYAAVTFDLPGGTFRDELYKAYKAQRIKQPDELYAQIPMIKEVVRAFGLPVVEKSGYEADDVIATLVEKFGGKASGPPEALPLAIETIIVTGDMDTLQLVDEHTKVYGFRKGFSDTAIYDEKTVQEKYGLRPDQIVDYKALRGDPADNIPGVRGIGNKTATDLLQKFGTLEEVYKNVGTISGRVGELLKESQDAALLGKKLVTLVKNVPLTVSLTDCKVPPPDNKKLREVFEKFGFKNLVARLDGEATKKQGELLGPSPGLQPSSPTGRERGEGINFIRQNNTVIGHDLKLLMREGTFKWQGEKLFDTMIASYLLHPGSRIHDLESVMREHNVGELSKLSFEREKAQLLIVELAEKVSIELKKENLTQIFETIEMPLIPILSAMEQAGIKVDTAYLKKLSRDFEQELARLTKEIYGQAGQEFNINSPLQLREVLFEKMKLAPETGRIKKTAKGRVASTAAGELEKLRGTHPIVDLIFEYRELSKLQSTYTDALIELIDKKDGRVHTTFNQAVAATGRLSSSNPNLQNIPIKRETGRQIRKAFVSERGYVFLAADYSQIELRVAASLSGDLEMIKAFQSGHDFHTETAARVFDVTGEKITPEMRRRAKAINFGIIYGMGATSLAIATKTTRDEAGRFIERYFEVFSGLRDYLEGLKDQARTHGFVETLFGRRRYLPEITSGVQQVRAAAERMAINMPVQGTAADLMKLAMIKLYNGFQQSPSLRVREGGGELRQNNEIRMLLQVHDELVFEIKKELVQEVAPKIRAIMENIHKLKVPIIVDFKKGENWGEMQAL